MRYMTNTGKGLILGVVLSIAAPAALAAADATALILAFLRVTLFDMLQEQFGFMKKGTESMVRQEAAGAVGIQAALKSHGQVTAGAIGQASAAELRDRNERMFSVMGHVNIDGTRVSIGSNAPSGCKQVRDATYLRRARPPKFDTYVT